MSSASWPLTYWAASIADSDAGHDGPVRGTCETDVAIIGGGYTGLSTAYHLAKGGTANPVVLEAERTGYGCSGRNGGLVRPALGRVPYAQWVQRWGLDAARALFDEAREAVALTRRLADSGDIDCEATTSGVLKVAHVPAAMAALDREAEALRETLGADVELVEGDTLRSHYLRSEESHGALRLRKAFSLNPLRYALQLRQQARGAGAWVHHGSRVVGWRKDGNQHVLTTPEATIYARHVVIATNGYGTERLCRGLQGTLMPMLSNIIVTRVLSESERERAGLFTHQAAFDTRRILNYYRLLPDGRVLFGSRGPIRESKSSRDHHRARLHTSLVKKFPMLRDVPVEHYWSGWVALPYDFTPHIGHFRDDSSIFFGLGYSGSGVAAATYAGKLLADSVSGAARPNPILREVPPRYPFPPLRKVAQALAVGWFQLLDDGRPW